MKWLCFAHFALRLDAEPGGFAHRGRTFDMNSCRLDLGAMAHDYDYVIVGSGFGGSVSALRLAEKGYRVAVIETGRRFEDKDFAKTAWNLRRYFWLPKFGLRGILRLSMFKDLNVVSGCGVGGEGPEDRKSTRLNSSHYSRARMPSSA